MTLSMARCIGRSDCNNPPNGGRGLCATCYSFHRYHDTLRNFPTMRERTAKLRAQGQLRVVELARQQHHAEYHARYTVNRRAVHYASRVELNGKLIHPGNAHGRTNTYTSLGCRGAMCYAAWCHYRVTGEGRLPEALHSIFGPEDCATYVSDEYPDTRK